LLQLVGLRRASCHAVATVAAVLSDVVQLRLRRHNQLPLVGSHAAQLRPAHGGSGIESLHVAVVAPYAFPFDQRRQQADSLSPVPGGKTEKIEYRRHDIDGAYLLAYDAA